MSTLIIIFIPTIVAVGFMVFSRVVPKEVGDIVLRETDPQHAAHLAAEYIGFVEDTKFGFPTGFFHIESIDGDVVVARETLFRGSLLLPIMKSLFRLVPTISAALGGWFGRVVGDVGLIIGTLTGGFLGICGVAYLVLPAVFLGVCEIALRRLARSRIVVTAESDGNDSRITVSLTGPSAWMVSSEISRAFASPQLPARIAAAAGVVQVPTETEAA